MSDQRHVQGEQTTRGTILIVDDNPDNLGFLFEYLVEEDYRVLVALSGEEALSRLDRARPDLILLDAVMPGIDGFETCARIRAEPERAEIPIIFMSALTEPRHKVKAFQHGAVDYVTKPVNKHEVLARVDTHMSLMRLRTQLVRRNEELEAFGRMLAHDLRGPLSTVLMCMQVAIATERGRMDAGTIEHHMLGELQVALEASRKMDDTIDAMLLLAGVGWGEVHREPVVMAEVVHRALHNMASTVRESGAEVRVPDELPRALGYGPWLEQVWGNLLSNGIKYGGRPPVLEVGANSGPGSMVTFWVRDNGPGIPPAMAQNIFEPFTRLSPERAHGHGLGLSIVERVITKLGGEVGARPLSGGGSEFSFTLRRAE